jgi:glyoxalase family protein
MRSLLLDCDALSHPAVDRQRGRRGQEQTMSGIHHVTAISGKASQNVDFYTRVLGLRLVKKTVNFDDPETYHLYYGDERGHPGTILTFFPWEHAAPGRNGVGQTEQAAFRVSAASMGYWTHRLIEKGVAHEALEKWFGESVLSFADPHGLRLALVGVGGGASEPAWSNGEIPAEHAIRSFHSVTLMLDNAGRTGAILTDVLGFKETGREGPFVRYETGGWAPGNVVLIREAGAFLPARMGQGSVHHVAFRAVDDAEQTQMADELREGHGLAPTPQIDRKYFRSVYFREPGGILFEIATDQPGFTVDEPLATLGRDLKLPSFLEAQRRDIEAALPRLDQAEKAPG